MTTLVTGASGFLGGTLANTLINKGEKVRILARTTSKLDHLKDLPLEIAYGSLEDQTSLIEDLLQKKSRILMKHRRKNGMRLRT